MGPQPGSPKPHAGSATGHERGPGRDAARCGDVLPEVRRTAVGLPALRPSAGRGHHRMTDAYTAAPQPWAGSTRAHRLPGDWKRRRLRVRSRAGGQCEWTTDDGRCPAPGNECDHIGDGANHDLANLRWLCHPHHARRTQAQAQAARPRLRRTPEPHPGLLP